MPATSWNEARIARLDRLWTEGLSASEIALQLGGVTRNAVLGKLHRLGRLGGRPKAAARPKTSTPQPPYAPRPKPPRPKPPRAMRPRAAAVPQPAWPGEVARVEDLRPRSCRWPIGDPLADGFSFCGHPAENGPYCEAHRQVAYLPGRKAAGARSRAA